jgi:hypothetical protein
MQSGVLLLCNVHTLLVLAIASALLVYMFMYSVEYVANHLGSGSLASIRNFLTCSGLYTVLSRHTRSTWWFRTQQQSNIIAVFSEQYVS